MATDQQDRPLTLTFSVRQSRLKKLEQLCLFAGKNRSELLALWIDSAYPDCAPGDAVSQAPPGEVTPGKASRAG
jgi:hypothetical protein